MQNSCTDTARPSNTEDRRSRDFGSRHLCWAELELQARQHTAAVAEAHLLPEVVADSSTPTAVVAAAYGIVIAAVASTAAEVAVEAASGIEVVEPSSPLAASLPEHCVLRLKIGGLKVEP